MNAATNRPLRRSAMFASPTGRSIALVVLIIAAFCLGGGSRSDIASLMILRPLAFLLLAYAIACLAPGDLARFRAIWVFAFLIILLAAVHVVPLPPSVWHQLPGRDLFAQVDRLAGLGDVWRPIAPVPAEAWNALFSLVVPLAALALLSVQRVNVFDRILLVLVCIGSVSMLLGMLQLLGPTQGPFYFYRITNPDSAVGFFSNRNHQAAFLATLLPMLAVWGSGGRAPRRGKRDMRPVRRALSFAAGSLALVFIILSGSRAGLLLGLLAALAAPFVLGTRIRDLLRPRAGLSKARGPLRLLRHWRITAALAALVIVAVLTATSGTAERFADDREGRPDMWRASWQMTKEYFPIGSGSGGFAEVFKIGEPYAMLSDRYVNHAHNDLIETVMTMGLPGALVLAGVLIAIALSFLALWRTRADKLAARVEARLGFVVLSLLLLASLVDYPLRTPALAVLFVIASAWLSSDLRRSEAMRRVDKAAL